MMFDSDASDGLCVLLIASDLFQKDAVTARVSLDVVNAGSWSADT